MRWDEGQKGEAQSGGVCRHVYLPNTWAANQGVKHPIHWNAFCHHLHLPAHDKETEELVASRQASFLKLNLGLVNEDAKVVQYLAELLKLHYTQEAPGTSHPTLRFDYVPSFLYKI